MYLLIDSEGLVICLKDKEVYTKRFCDLNDEDELFTFWSQDIDKLKLYIENNRYMAPLFSDIDLDKVVMIEYDDKKEEDN